MHSIETAPKRLSSSRDWVLVEELVEGLLESQEVLAEEGRGGIVVRVERVDIWRCAKVCSNDNRV